jgi:O-antigen/teichoic acid export membrane protein
VCGAIVNVILNSLMIPKLQSLGAVIATVVAEFSVTAMEFYFVRKEFEIKEILILSRNYIVSALIMFIIVQIPKVLIHSGIITILVQVIFGVIVYFVALLTIKDEMIIELKNKFLKKRIKE